MQDFEKQRKDLMHAIEKRDENSVKGIRTIQQSKRDIDDRRSKIQKIKLKMKKLDKKQQAIENKNIEKLQDEIKQLSALPIYEGVDVKALYGNDFQFYELFGKVYELNYTEFVQK